MSLYGDRGFKCAFFKLGGERICTCDWRLIILVNKPGLVQFPCGFRRTLLVVIVEKAYWLALWARLFSDIDNLESLVLLMLGR